MDGFIPQKKTEEKKQMVTRLHFLNKSSILCPWKHFYHLHLFTMHEDLKNRRLKAQKFAFNTSLVCLYWVEQGLHYWDE